MTTWIVKPYTRHYTSITEFEDHANLYPATALCNRLQGLITWVSTSVVLPYEQHSGEGYVSVFMSEVGGIMFHWVENGELVADRAWFQARGRTVLSVAELMDLIKDMIGESTTGSWEKAAEWLSKYGKSPGVDFEKVPWPPLSTAI